MEDLTLFFVFSIIGFAIAIWYIENRKSKPESLSKDVKIETTNNLLFVDNYYRHTINFDTKNIQPTSVNADFVLMAFVENTGSLYMDEAIAKATQLITEGKREKSNSIIAGIFYPNFSKKDFSANDIDHLTFSEKLMLIKLVYSSTPSNRIKKHIASQSSGMIYIERERFDCIVLQSSGNGSSVYNPGTQDLYMLRENSYDINLVDILKQNFIVEKVNMSVFRMNRLGARHSLDQFDLENIIMLRGSLFDMTVINKAVGMAQCRI